MPLQGIKYNVAQHTIQLSFAKKMYKQSLQHLKI